MDDPNRIICTGVHSASVELLSDEEIRRLSCCRITSAAALVSVDGTEAAATALSAGGGLSAVPGGLHDPRLGPLDGRDVCQTCGLSGSCLGHIGHIELHLPALQPLLLPGLVRLLKMVCFQCQRVRQSNIKTSLVVKRFELLQLLMPQELQKLDNMTSASGRGSGKHGGETKGDSSQWRSHLLEMFASVDEELALRMQREEPLGGHCKNSEIDGDAAATARQAFLLKNLSRDLSKSNWQVTTWREMRKRVFEEAAAVGRCSHCGIQNAVSVHLASKGSGVELRWPWRDSLPYGSNSFFGSLFSAQGPGYAKPSQSKDGENTDSTSGANSKTKCSGGFNGERIKPDDTCLKYWKNGKAIGSVQLQGFQLLPLVEALFSKDGDRRLFSYLFPMSVRLGAHVFFMKCVAVSANKFRLPVSGTAGSPSAGRLMLHPRTQQLRDLLVINEKLKFALAVLNHPDPLNAVRDSKSLMRLLHNPEGGETGTSQDEHSAVEDELTSEQRQLIQEFVIQHAAGGGSWLSTYALQQQLKLNELVDSTRAEKPQGAPPGIRQWMEKKQGAIRQKMMGKRVNYAARTVLAPDGLLGSNEVGVPLEFAMKLSIPEPVTGRNAHLLSRMVENGPFKHPGALGVEDQNGVMYNLEVMPAAARRAKAQQILNFATSTEDGRGFRVFRHLLDGDVVLMNRQPSLHRLSLMAHFVSITRPLSSKYNVNTFLDMNGLRKKSGGYKKVTKAMMLKQRRQEELEQQREEQQLQQRDAIAAKAAAANKEKGMMERVFRLNFVNCSSYNADFDGDEMNMHVPQDPIARAEAAYILNADAQFAVPKNGDIIRGLIQDFCLAGCLLTCRDTLLDIHQFQNLVFSAVGNYVNSHGSVLVLDRTQRLSKCCSTGTAAATATAAAAASTDFSAIGLGVGDPYKRQLIAAAGGNADVVSGLNIHVEPPAIVHPRKLWTGKQVVTTVLKTLIDGIARARLRRGCWKKDEVETVTSGYRGINLTATSKTPGDAWGGVEDGDKEESTVIIRDSELLQGVFDKNQFGSSSGGLLHLVFLLLGSAASSLLLQALASLFCCFLKMHGATTSPADFVMTCEGEQQRQALVHRIVRAGTFLQEHFASRISALMGWSFDSAKQKLRRHVSSIRSVVTPLTQKGARVNATAGTAVNVKRERMDAVVGDVATAVQEASLADKSASGIEERGHVLLRMALDSKPRGSSAAAVQNGTAKTVQLEKMRLARLADAAAELMRSAENVGGNSGFVSKTQEGTSLCLDPWMLLRQQKHTSIATAQQPTAASSAEQLANLLRIMEQMQHSPEQRMQLLLLLSCSPLLRQQLPRVSNVLKASRLLSPPAAQRRLENDSNRLDGRKNHPSPNIIVSLPDGGYIEGRASLLKAKLRHPSWLWSGSSKRRSNTAGAVVAANEFESTSRYVLQSASAVAASANQRHMRAFLEPSEITKARIGSVYEDHFLGKAEMFDEMLDSYFQSSLAKVASRSTEIMKGRFFLNRFPRNGFASMIKSGSKGSNVNFSMICIFLEMLLRNTGQQSLEGRRVKVMASGRSLPAFANADFGAMARGFVLSSFLEGLREEEFYFHCMAGREGLIDTAVKTAKSGYLQRSLMKSLESLRLSYDGSVRDQDGSIVQFVYGDDGRDPSNTATFKHLELLFDNPYLLKRLNRPPPELYANVKAQNAALKRQRPAEKNKDVDTLEPSIDDDAYLNHMWTRPFDSPLSAIGTTSLKYEQELGSNVDKIFKKYTAIRNMHMMSGSRKHRKKILKRQENDDNLGLDKNDLESLMRVVYHKCCMKPGESVGCVAAQSIGEPATQMTLNTFHLAGHGAANVTMGIPRLRELLQLGARTQTPQIYIPLLQGGDGLPSEVRERLLAQNAATAMRGFTTIHMQDFIHAVGVEANVFYQSPYTKGGCPMIPPGESDQYWEYDVTFQFEPLNHFCAVYKQFQPLDLIHLVLKKVVRAFLRKVRKLMAAYVAHYGCSNPHVAQSDMEAFFQEFICQDRLKTHWDKRAEVRDILRSGNLAGGEASPSNDTFGERQSNQRQSAAGGEEEEGGVARADASKDDVYETDDVKGLKREKDVDDEEPQDGDHASEDESEESDEEKALAGDLDIEAGESEDEESDQRGLVTTEIGDSSRKRKGIKSELQHDESCSSSDSADEDNTLEEVKQELEDSEHAGRKSKRVRSAVSEPSALDSGTPILNLADLLVGKVFNRSSRIFVEDVRNSSESQCASCTPFEAQASPIEDDAIWGSAGKTMGLVSLDPESASILHDIKICTTSWRVVLKFGWPTKKCPYRLEVLPLLKSLIEKCTLQAPEGVSAARIVQGSGCVTGSRMEVHCDGSNLRWIHKLKETAVDHNRIATNDVVAILKFYGVEAARAAFIKELKSVFGAYGIQLGEAHLKIVADYVTNDGTLTAFNRLGIGSSSSPFLQMSFETSFKFLTEACERAAVDNLQSPSGSLFVGSPAAIGSQQSALLTVLPDF